MRTTIHKADPARLVRKKCWRSTPDRPATAGTTWETPGSHLENSNVRLVLFSKKSLERRTQLSGSKEMRQSVERTESPFFLPSSYQRASPTTQAIRTSQSARSKRICPAAASDPAATSTGENSSGAPVRSSRPEVNSTIYGWLTSRFRIDFTAKSCFWARFDLNS